MPALEVFVLAGVLHETTDRPGPDVATRDHCRRWSAYLTHLLSLDPPSAHAAGRVSAGQRPLPATLAPHPLGEALSRLKWHADLRRSHRVHDASVDPGLASSSETAIHPIPPALTKSHGLGRCGLARHLAVDLRQG
jgi:hypothetical protein